MAVNQVATLGVKVDPKGAIQGARRAKKAIQGIGKVASRVKSSIFSLQGAFVGLGAGLAIKSAISYGSEIESLRIRLKFLTGSTEKATKAFDQMLAVSKTAPVSLKEIQRASPLLLTVADDIEELTSLLEMTGDIAEVSGLSFEKTAEQIQRSFSAGIASAELFREKAVTSMLGFEMGVSKTGAETKKIFTDMFKNGTTVMKGAMQEGAKTMKGQISMMKDGWDGLLLAFSDAGAFDATKRAMKEIEKTLKSEEGLKMAEDFGRAVGQFIDGTVGMKDALFDMIATLDTSLMFFGRMPQTLGGIEKAIANVKGEIEDLTGSMVDIEGDGMFNWILNLGKDLTMDHTAKQIIKGLESDMQELLDLKIALMKNQNLIADNDNKELGLEAVAFKQLGEAVSTTGQSFAFLSHNAHMAKNAVEIMQDQFGEFIIITDEAKEKQKEFADGLSSSIEESIMNMTKGLMSFKDVVKNVFQYVAAQVVRNNIANPLAKYLSQIMGGAIGGFATGTAPLPNIGGDRHTAIGGGVMAGGSYVVGERGPELFTPQGNGMITPNHRMGGGQTINVSYSPQVNALDPITASNVIGENAPTIVNIIRQAFNENGQEVAI